LIGTGEEGEVWRNAMAVDVKEGGGSIIVLLAAAAAVIIVVVG